MKLAYIFTISLMVVTFQSFAQVEAEQKVKIQEKEEKFTSGGFEDVNVAAPNHVVVPHDGNEIHEIVDEVAQFPGGKDAFNSYVNKHLKYPEFIHDIEMKERTFLTLVIDKEGAIKDVTVKRGAKNCPECDREAVRLIKSMPKWIPAKLNAENVNSYYHLPIVFDTTKK